MSDISAATGTLDTSETGGAHAGTSVVEQPSEPGPLVIAEGRAFRSEEETRALVNLAYGVEDADDYANPAPAPQVGAPVETALFVPTPAQVESIFQPEPVVEPEVDDTVEGEDVEPEEATDEADEADEPEEVPPYSEWTNAELQAELASRPGNLAHTGTKAEMVARLEENDAADEAAGN